MANRGFTLIEIMVVIGIMMLLFSVGVLSINMLLERMVINAATNELIFTLEEAKAGAVAGSQGDVHGVYFSGNGYTEYIGDIDNHNVTHDLDGRLQLETDIINTDNSVTFSRITGAASQRTTITISFKDQPEKQSVVVIGKGGDISRSE